MKNIKKIVKFILSFGLVAGAFAAEDGAILGQYGAITVKMLNGKKTALISSTSTETVEIAEDVEIDSIYYDRDYSGEWGKPGTLMLPFDFPPGCLSQFGQIYEMTGIGINGQNTWQIDAKNTGSNGEFSANRPYFVRPNAVRMIFPEWCASNVVMKKNVGVDTKFTFGNWEFRGMYSYKKWEEGDSDIGRAYGFAAKEKEVDGKLIQQGQFVKVKAGASIRPFRGYLIYNRSSVLAKSAAYSAIASIDEEDLPSTIEVVFHDDDETTAIYELNPRTGEFSTATGWYDMKGRKLNKKPTIKGNYFYNGKKVTIK
jgi:hypothetical protein